MKIDKSQCIIEYFLSLFFNSFSFYTKQKDHEKELAKWRIYECIKKNVEWFNKWIYPYLIQIQSGFFPPNGWMTRCNPQIEIKTNLLSRSLCMCIAFLCDACSHWLYWHSIQKSVYRIRLYLILMVLWLGELVTMKMRSLQWRIGENGNRRCRELHGWLEHNDYNLLCIDNIDRSISITAFWLHIGKDLMKKNSVILKNDE